MNLRGKLTTLGVSFLLAGGATFSTAKAQTATLDVSAEVVSSPCTLSGGSLNFGQYISGQSADVDNQATLEVDCDQDVVLNFSTGDSFNSTDRGMSSPGGDILRYNLYIGTAGGIIAGKSGEYGTDYGVPAVGESLKDVTVYGRVFGSQAVPQGAYSDTVQVTMVVQ